MFILISTIIFLFVGVDSSILGSLFEFEFEEILFKILIELVLSIIVDYLKKLIEFLRKVLGKILKIDGKDGDKST